MNADTPPVCVSCGDDGCKNCTAVGACVTCYGGFTLDTANKCVANEGDDKPCATGFFRDADTKECK